MQKKRQLIKLDNCEQEFHVVISYNLARETCSDDKKSVIVPSLISIEIENIDWRQIPRYIYKQIEEKCKEVISDI
jgi:hypothetical protein